MCSICGGHENGSTRHLLYWQKEWLRTREWKRFFKTWKHILYRRSYYQWKVGHDLNRLLNSNMPDDGRRMELDRFLKSVGNG